MLKDSFFSKLQPFLQKFPDIKREWLMENTHSSGLYESIEDLDLIFLGSIVWSRQVFIHFVYQKKQKLTKKRGNSLKNETCKCKHIKPPLYYQKMQSWAQIF